MSSRSDSSETGTIATARTGAYVGRFAPSPTGPLHFGSLLAALASFLEARTRDGLWLIRVEDIDSPREQPGATEQILTALEAYGFEWDGPVTYQSDSRKAHDAAIRDLLEGRQAYRCGCSRSDLEAAPRGPLGAIYPGYCRDGSDASETAIRVRTRDEAVDFDDRLQGIRTQQLETESGDFVILRRDGLVAYQLAVVVDDYLQGVTEIVRGIDLIDSTPRQIWLQRLLRYPQPDYLHIPIAVNRAGQKLSKSTGAGAVSLERISETLVSALAVLEQRPPPALARGAPAAIWGWALDNWDISVLQGRTEFSVEHIALANAENGLS